jgi:hypothetical protein
LKVPRRDLDRLCGFSALAVASLTALSGCGGTCASNCPPIVFNVIATAGETLSLATAQWTGTACPGNPPICGPDYTGANNCVGLSIIAVAPGTCTFDLTFSDGRAPYSVTAEFGTETHQGCCHGLPVLGPTSAIIPPLHPVASTDAGTDAADGGNAVPDAGGSDAAGAPPGDSGTDGPLDSSDGDT